MACGKSSLAYENKFKKYGWFVIGVDVVWLLATRFLVMLLIMRFQFFFCVKGLTTIFVFLGFTHQIIHPFLHIIS